MSGRARIYRPSTTPYVRVDRGIQRMRYWLAEGGCLDLDPAMARLVAAALLRAADRIDPERKAPPPWKQPT